MNGVKLVGIDAIESKFKQSANHYGVLHLAMHALIDDKKPMYSKLAFSLVEDGTDDGFLNAYELYNMELSAELVVLSACETGYGKLEKGEGMMSLAHAFTYAGCPSIVMSQWLADDKATAQLMKLFYKNLATGCSKDEALQKAKIEFISDADEVRQNPAFWAGFVVMGDTSPLYVEPFFERNWIYITLSCLLLTVFATVYIRRKE
jgi:CHAT domain-containing protein